MQGLYGVGLAIRCSRRFQASVNRYLGAGLSAVAALCDTRLFPAPICQSHRNSPRKWQSRRPGVPTTRHGRRIARIVPERCAKITVPRRRPPCGSPGLVYDAAYLELAQREGLPLATLDGQLQKAAAEAGIALVGPRAPEAAG